LWIWIRHGIQALTPESARRLEDDEDRPFVDCCCGSCLFQVLVP
jgi:hypothetical protein